MFKKILSLLKKNNIPAKSASLPSISTTVATGSDSNDNRPKEDAQEQVPLSRWLESTDPGNPFGIAGCDCFPFTQSMRSTTSSQEAVVQFFNLRADFGKHLIGASPENPVNIPCKLEYAYSGEVEDGAIFKASQMEQKWDIYLYHAKLYFCRSWTGTLIYTADIRFEEHKACIDHIQANKDGGGDDVDYLIRDVDYLIRSHVHGEVTPHPLPKNFPLDMMAIAAFSFKAYGDRCCFATYEDTVSFVRPARPANTALS